jgi:hypothetical protein
LRTAIEAHAEMATLAVVVSALALPVRLRVRSQFLAKEIMTGGHVARNLATSPKALETNSKVNPAL